MGLLHSKYFNSGGARSAAAAGAIGFLAKQEAMVGQIKLTIDDECECRQIVNEVPEWLERLALFFQL